MANILFFGYNDEVMRRFFTLILTAVILLNVSYVGAATVYNAPMPSLINDFDDDKADIIANNVPMPENDDDTPNPKTATAATQILPMISSWEVDNRETLNNERVISKSSYKISAIYPSNVINVQGAGYPGYRGPGQLVVYRQNFGRTTGTNEFGKEAVVEDGKVVKLTGANSLIPKNGYVISGHGSAKKWITNNLKIGTNIFIDENKKTITAYTTVESYRFYAKAKIKEVEEFLDSSRKIADNPGEKKAKYYLRKAKHDLRKSSRANDNMAVSYAQSSIEMSKIALNYALPYIENELKGTWIRPVEKNTAEIRRTLDNIKSIGINTIFLETYFHGYTIFPSRTMKSYNFTQQNPVFAGFDPLKTYVSEAHVRKMKVHVWFESFYVGNKHPSNDPNSILSIKPAWANKNKANYDKEGYVSHPVEHNGYFLDPANPEVQNFLVLLVKEIVSDYDVDGVNLDYIRYPSAQKSTSAGYEASNWGYTPYAIEEFKRIYDINPITIKYKDVAWARWNQYRQDKITNYLSKMRKAVRGKVILSAVIFPDYRTCLETKQQDWQKWTEKGYLDAVTPLILTADDSLFELMYREIKSKIPASTIVYPGLFVGFMEGEAEDLLKQINVSRSMKSGGVVLFDWAHLGNKYKDALKFCVFTSTCK